MVGLNKQKGNMYPWVTHTCNFIKGICPHDCSYCFMKLFPLGNTKLDEREFNTQLGKNNIIFIGSSCDMWADSISSEWVIRILDYCKKFDNTYLFQTKNPWRFVKIGLEKVPCNSILGVTIETNRPIPISKAPHPAGRVSAMEQIYTFPKMVSIEPIMDFDDDFSQYIRLVKPKFVSIGADSKGHNLPEPSKKKTLKLIGELGQFTEVRIKDNLKRIIE